MTTTIKCYKYSLKDDPFLEIHAESADEMFKELADKISWRDFANDIWVKISSCPALLYSPALHSFKDWNGMRFADINNERVVNYYF